MEVTYVWRSVKQATKAATCSGTLLQNELNSDVALFTTNFSGCEELLHNWVESSSTFCNQICTCCAFYRPKANFFCSKWLKSCVWRDSRVILSNQKSVFEQLATTSFVARQVSMGVSGKTRKIAFQLVLQQCCKRSWTILSPFLP